jgi:phage-related minor tail protein
VAGKPAKVSIEIEADASQAVKAIDETASGFGKITEAAKMVGLGAAAVFAGDLLKEGFSKAVEFISDSFNEALDLEAANDKMAAQLGLTQETAGKFGKLAGDVYSGNFGESMEQVNDSFVAITKNIGEGNEDWLKGMSEDVLAFSDTFGEDLGPTTVAVGKLMKTGLAANAQEALDILTKGMQTGANASEDLLDTFTEYPSVLKDLGLTGQQAMGLINQGLEAGARSSDLVADAFKEFGIRSKDMSELTSNAFTTLGLDAKKMTEIFAKGGPEAAAGLDTVLDGLRDIKDPALQSGTAVALFGTQAEDLGTALLALDPSEATNAIGEVTGATDKMADTLGDNSKGKIEAFKRNLETNVTGFITDNVLPKLAELGDGVGKLWDKFQESEFLADLKTNLKDLSDNVMPPITDAVKLMTDQFTTFTTWAADNKEVMDGLKIFLIALAVALLAVVVIIGVLVTASIALSAVFGVIMVGTIIAFKFALEQLWRALQFGWDILKNVGSFLADVFRGIIDGVIGSFNWLKITVVDVFNKIKDVITGVGDWVKNTASTMWNGVFDGLVSAFKWAINAVLRAWNDLSFTVPSINVPGLGEIGGWRFDTPNIPLLAKGGIVRHPTLAIIGESGPEAVVPLGSNMGGTVINVHIHTDGLGADSPQIQRQVVDAIRRYEARNGPVMVSA